MGNAHERGLIEIKTISVYKPYPAPRALARHASSFGFDVASIFEELNRARYLGGVGVNLGAFVFGFES